MENAKEDLVWPLERCLSDHFKQLNNTCKFPNGKMDGRDVFCGRDAVQEVEGSLFCSLHAPMAERGCLDIEYTDGTTPRG